MATYKLRKLNPDGTPFTDEQMRAHLTETGFSAPDTPIIPPYPKKPIKPAGMSNRDFQPIWDAWQIEKWRPYQGALDEREMIVNQFASWLAVDFILMQVRARGEYRIKRFWGGYVMFARNLTGYYKARPADPVEYVIHNTIKT